MNLGFDEKDFTVRWMEKYDLMWRDLVPDVHRAASAMGEPSIVFIHLGSSELGQEPFAKFLSVVKHDLGRLTESYPNTIFIWSTIMPRREWMNTIVEKLRRKYNGKVSFFAKTNGLKVSYLNDVEKIAKDRILYRGKVSLEDISEVFIRSLKRSLDFAIKELKIKSL